MRGRLSFPRWWFPWLVPTLKISLSPAEQQRTERVVAVARFFFSGVSLLAVWIDPTLLTSDPVVAYTLFGGYLAAATVMCVRLRGTYIPTRRVQVAWHAGDLVWMAMLTQMTEGPNSPFPLVYFFVLLSAAYRWGFLETVGTAIFVVGVVVFQFLLQSDGFAGETAWFDMKGPLVRTSYVSIAGGLLGYLAEEERYRRTETVIVGRLMPKIRPDTSMRATLETAAAEILPLLSAHTLLVSW